MAEKKQTGVFVMWSRPDFASIIRTDKNYRSNFHGAMLYAHYELSAIDLKKEVLKYLKHLDTKNPMIDRIKDIHENRFTTVGKYMYILNHGGEIPEDVSPKLMPAFEKIIYDEEEKKNTINEAANYLSKEEVGDKSIDNGIKVVTIQDRLKEKAREVAGEVEGWLDDFCMDKKSSIKTVEEFINFYKSNDLKAPHVRYLRNIFERRCNEIINAVEESDKDLIDGYSNFTKPELKKFALLHSNLLKACDMMQEVAKIERAPKKKKPISHEKLISKIKYKKEDKVLGIVSVNPTSMIGAKEIWCYNTKTRKITKFIADDLLGPLSVKGASIIGYNEVKSISKTLRKPAEQLAEFKKLGKIQLRTYMENIKSVEIKAKGKMNEDIIILKVDK